MNTNRGGNNARTRIVSTPGIFFWFIVYCLFTNIFLDISLPIPVFAPGTHFQPPTHPSNPPSTHFRPSTPFFGPVSTAEHTYEHSYVCPGIVIILTYFDCQTHVWTFGRVTCLTIFFIYKRQCFFSQDCYCSAFS